MNDRLYRNRFNELSSDLFHNSYQPITLQYLVHNVLQPLLHFSVDIAASLLLFFTFVIQSVSALLAFDSLVTHMYSIACSSIATAISYFMKPMIPSNQDRYMAAITVVEFWIQIFLTQCIYSIHSQTYQQLFFAPMLSVLVVQIALSFFAQRIQVEQDSAAVIPFGVLVMCLLIQVVNIITTSPDILVIEKVLLLRYSIDTLSSATHVLIGSENSGGNRNDLSTALSYSFIHYGSMILKRSFWAALHLLYFLRLGPKRPRLLFFLLLFHDVIELSLPFSVLMKQIAHFIAVKRLFKPLSAEEVADLVNEPCSVCLSPHTAPHSVRLSCGHVLHGTCLTQLIQQASSNNNPIRCPLCRADILPSRSSTQHESAGEESDANRNSRGDGERSIFTTLGSSNFAPAGNTRLWNISNPVNTGLERGVGRLRFRLGSISPRSNTPYADVARTALSTGFQLTSQMTNAAPREFLLNPVDVQSFGEENNGMPRIFISATVHLEPANDVTAAEPIDPNTQSIAPTEEANMPNIAVEPVATAGSATDGVESEEPMDIAPDSEILTLLNGSNETSESHAEQPGNKDELTSNGAVKSDSMGLDLLASNESSPQGSNIESSSDPELSPPTSNSRKRRRDASPEHCAQSSAEDSSIDRTAKRGRANKKRNTPTRVVDR